MNDLSMNSVFYRELVECWLEFRNLFLADKERLCIVWNNKDVRIDEKPVFYNSYYDSGIFIIKDLLFNLDNMESFNVINNIVEKANFLTVDRSQVRYSENNRVYYLYRKYLFYKEE